MVHESTRPSLRARRLTLGELLVSSGAVSQLSLDMALRRAQASGERLGSVLVQYAGVDADAVSEALARQHGVEPCRDHDLRDITGAAMALVPAAVAHDHCVVPLRLDGTTLVVAMRDPGDEDAVTELWRRTGLRIQPMVASEQRLRAVLDHLYGPAVVATSHVAPRSLPRGTPAPEFYVPPTRVNIPRRTLHDTRPPAPIMKGPALLDSPPLEQRLLVTILVGAVLAMLSMFAYYL